MAANQGFRAIDTEPFVYQENSGSTSVAMGIDKTNVFSISVVGSAGASPNPTSQFVVIPGGNTKITPSIRFVVDGPAEIVGGLKLDTLAAVSVLVTDVAGNVGSVLPAAANTVLVSNGVGVAPSFQAVPATAGVTSIAGTANQITASAATGAVTLSTPATFIAPGSIASTTSITAGNLSTAGIVYNAVTTGLLSSHQTTNHNVQIGNASGQLADVAPSATSGVPLISQGAAADPAFGTAVVAGGGTGNTTFTAFSVIAAGTTATGAFQNVSGTGSANQVLVAQPGALPIWAAVPATAGVTSITGTANQITASASTGAVTLSTPSTFIAPGTIASTTTSAAGTNFLLPTTTSTVGNILWGTSGSTGRIIFPNTTTNANTNFFAGQAAGNFTLSGVNNVGISYGALNILTSGSDNICLGNEAGVNMTSATHNVAICQDALGNGSIQTHCIAIGNQALKGVGFPGGTAANYDIGIGFQAGFNYANSGESSNICLNSPGVAAESHKLRIGNGTGTGTQQLNGAFISGIYNTAVGATAGVALVDSTDQIGGLNGGAGTVLVGGTKPAFTTLSTLAVTSITGTANQITASASTGAVTLSTPSTFIAPGTIASTTTNAAGTNFILPVTTASAGQILQNSVRVFHTFGTDNTFVGSGAGNLTLTTSERNVAIGVGAGASLSSTPGHNVYVGYQAGNADDGTGGTNVAVGFQALLAFSGGTTPRNVAIGPSSLIALAGAGVHNTCLGYNTGSAYTTTESDNILIGYNTAGTIGESNVLRIGVGTGTGNGQVNKAFVAGIQGITVTGTAVLVSASDQLGIAVSSRRFKDNIQDMDSYSSDLLKLRPVTFNYNVGDDQSLQSGLIAEEVADIMPQLVVNDKEGLPQTVKYHDLPALLLNEIQKLNKRIQALEAR